MSEVQMNAPAHQKDDYKYKAIFFTWNAPDDDNTFDWCLRQSTALKVAIQNFTYLLAYQWESEIGKDGRNHL